ncbi:MAG: type IV pilus twitching motility protein PilT [Planctomycetes bacterium]|nr:type IV pilus twitching motility protein PilT [Planctomycetota bacterium]
MAEIDKFLSFLRAQEGSDLHLSPGSRLTFRLHGSIAGVAMEPFKPADTERLIFEIAPERNKQEFAECNDTDFAYDLPGVARFRVNVFRDRHGVGAVLRVIPTEILSADQLNLPESVRYFCHLPKGLVLVTGPTGSGKSTTLAAMIDLINKSRRDHIITIEDPIEFVHPNKNCLVNQREVHAHTNSFARALRAALREDPDVVLVGEMRDLETTHIAIETAETGHLVFGTLHTNTAASTVDRIIDQFPADQHEQIRTMLASSLKGVVAQTLLKKRPKGRVAALEVLVVTPGISNNIREGKTHQIPSSMQVGGRVGMVLLNDAVLKHVMAGTVDPAEAYSKVVDRNDLLEKFKVAGIPFDPNKGGT